LNQNRITGNFNGDDQAEVDAFFRMMKADEAARKEANEKFISNIEKDLEKLHEKIVEDMKTKSRAVRLRELVRSRLFVLSQTCETDERFADRWREAIETAKYLIEKIDRKVDFCPINRMIIRQVCKFKSIQNL
jgi:hypothetical protein